MPSHTQKERDKLYKVFGWAYEDVKNGIIPMAMNGKEPTASMGHDIPLAILSKKHPSLIQVFRLASLSGSQVMTTELFPESLISLARRLHAL